MANEKKYKIRQAQKTDTEANWSRAKNFIPEKGEIIVYQEVESKESKIKIGNGTDTVNNLPFISGGGAVSAEMRNKQLVIEPKINATLENGVMIFTQGGSE